MYYLIIVFMAVGYTVKVEGKNCSRNCTIQLASLFTPMYEIIFTDEVDDLLLENIQRQACRDTLIDILSCFDKEYEEPCHLADNKEDFMEHVRTMLVASCDDNIINLRVNHGKCFGTCLGKCKKLIFDAVEDPFNPPIELAKSTIYSTHEFLTPTNEFYKMEDESSTSADILQESTHPPTETTHPPIESTYPLPESIHLSPESTHPPPEIQSSTNPNHPYIQPSTDLTKHCRLFSIFGGCMIYCIADMCPEGLTHFKYGYSNIAAQASCIFM